MGVRRPSPFSSPRTVFMMSALGPENENVSSLSGTASLPSGMETTGAAPASAEGAPGISDEGMVRRLGGWKNGLRGGDPQVPLAGRGRQGRAAGNVGKEPRPFLRTESGKALVTAEFLRPSFSGGDRVVGAGDNRKSERLLEALLAQPSGASGGLPAWRRSDGRSYPDGGERFPRTPLLSPD